MPLTVHQFACLSDNYGFLVRDEATGKTATIDTPDADAILAQLDTLGWTLDLILNTHWHPDHAGGNAVIKAATGATIVGPAEVTRIAPLDRPVGDGDVVELGESPSTSSTPAVTPWATSPITTPATPSPSSATPCSPWAAADCSRARPSRCGPLWNA